MRLEHRYISSILSVKFLAMYRRFGLDLTSQNTSITHAIFSCSLCIQPAIVPDFAVGYPRFLASGVFGAGILSFSP